MSALIFRVEFIAFEYESDTAIPPRISLGLKHTSILNIPFAISFKLSGIMPSTLENEIFQN